MTKQKELDILDAAVVALGRESYCGGWLASVRAEVASNLKSDIYPAATIGDTARRCEEMQREARERADQIAKQADAYASNTISAARTTADGIRGRIARQINQVWKEVTA